MCSDSGTDITVIEEEAYDTKVEQSETTVPIQKCYCKVKKPTKKKKMVNMIRSFFKNLFSSKIRKKGF